MQSRLSQLAPELSPAPLEALPTFHHGRAFVGLPIDQLAVQAAAALVGVHLPDEAIFRCREQGVP